jgi:hypothetical protein
MYKVEYFDITGNNWILKSRHKGLDHAQIMAQVQQQAGFRTRIIRDGKIIEEG